MLAQQALSSNEYLFVDLISLRLLECLNQTDRAKFFTIGVPVIVMVPVVPRTHSIFLMSSFAPSFSRKRMFFNVIFGKIDVFFN